MNILKGFTFSHTHGENKNHNPIGHDVKLLKSLRRTNHGSISNEDLKREDQSKNHPETLKTSFFFYFNMGQITKNYKSDIIN